MRLDETTILVLMGEMEIPTFSVFKDKGEACVLFF
jgi:hypothetical protein